MGISLGLVGLGMFGSEFAGLFNGHPAVDRIALCDREPERLEAFAGKESFQDKFDPSDAYSSLEDICRADLDALVIITQPWLHAQQAVKAMESGKHVYSAVPVVELPDGDEILDWCDRIIETCRRTGMHYMLGETTYYRPQAMYCRCRAAKGAFGDFVYSEGEYFHDVDSPSCNLREVRRSRMDSQAGREWAQVAERYRGRSAVSGPMHYPTHSISGPISVMKAHMTKVCAYPYRNRTGDDFFGNSPSNETALFLMSNGATSRICEYREIGHSNREIFRIYGTQGSFEHDAWCDKSGAAALTVDEMRDPLPPEVVEAFSAIGGKSDFYGGHGGSHAYLVHEFVDAIAGNRTPAINAWEAVRYMAAGVAAHKSAMRDGERLDVQDWGDAPG
ncbi:MAG: Gfo/Idh/MocA family oxidoreductase [Armatimonadetes bacterium]|nr:Gfo/Idh/MocA family oxidoreductase [Armatimonadota bacterium]